MSSTPPHIDGTTSGVSTTSKPSLFIKKKPTVAVIGSRPLIRPYRKHGIDYDNPGKFDPPEWKQSTLGTAIAIPTSSPHTTEAAVAPPMTSAPFTFDNHTPESQVAQSMPMGNISGSKRGAETSPPGNDGLTILRIKRKRHEEPLDTLVVQEQFEKLAGKKQKKIEDEIKQEIDSVLAEKDSKPKSSPAVFRLATTVNKEIFKDPTQSLQLRDTITHMAETPQLKSRQAEKRLSEVGKRVTESRANLANSLRGDAKTARYRVINQNRSGLTSSKKAPPEVKSSAQVEAESALDMFKMYDAVKEEDPKTKKQLQQETEENDIMCNFLPMVREYLSISDRTQEPQKESDDHSSKSRPQSTFAQEAEDSEDEYVYDIYYRDANADHQQESKHRGIGSLLWFDDDEGNFMNEDDSSDDDYEDSDSNAEDYYQNDYPEDELSEDDLAYELSDTEDDEYMY
ncbi:hypothetical protein BGZ74_005467 [Mortierella antarctica]|nr:hypothetical protein BGZ74_005467 [Mortierella antarctica]